MSPRRWTMFAWFAASAGLALSGWLFLTRAARSAPARPGLRLALVDVSASQTREPAWLAWVRSELGRAAAAARGAGEDFGVLAFADGVASAFPPGDPARFVERLEGRAGRPFEPGSGLARGATRLDDALEAAQALLAAPDRAPSTALFLGPMTYTGDSPDAALARLAATGVALSVSAPPPVTLPDLGLLELVLAPRSEAGAPLIALARLCWRGGTRPRASAQLVIEVECDGETRSFAYPLTLPAVDGEFELPLDCGAAGFGRNRVRARCTLASGADLFPENDRAEASSVAQGARVIAVAVRPEHRELAQAWLAPAGRSALAGLQFLFVPPEELARVLDDCDALVTFDLAPGDLVAPLLLAFVRQGGGWLALSGYGFLADWSPGEVEGAVHQLLPCEPAATEAGPRDVVLLVDGSGSMEGEPFESVRSAALELVAAALPSDRVSLRFFTVSLELEHLLKPRGPGGSGTPAGADAARRAARELLALRVPSGTTFLVRSLREFAREAGGHQTLLLLLTDGWEREGLPDEAGLADRARAELAQRDVELVVIAVGEKPNQRLLATLAGGPENVRAGRTLADLRAVFHRELHGSRLAEGELPIRLAPSAPGSLADEVQGGGDAGRALEPLERYVRNRLRPGASALWESAEGEPVLALVRAGLGRVALFASRPGAGWASRYVRVGLGEPAEFEGLLRWLARGREARPAASAARRGERLSVTGLSGNPAVVLEAEVLDLERGERETIVLTPPGAPGWDVLRTREGILGQAREWEQVALLLPARAGEPELALEVAAAPRDEFAWRERAARMPTGPRAQGATRSQHSHPLAVPVLALALGLLFLAGLLTARRQGLEPFGR